jgi:hypothetical protein
MQSTASARRCRATTYVYKATVATLACTTVDVEHATRASRTATSRKLQGTASTAAASHERKIATSHASRG